METARGTLERRDVLEMQSLWAGVVLTDDDPVEAAFRSQLQRPPIDVEIARARVQVGVERRLADQLA